jgi:Holliday junction resolvase RusA-like endonuclease
MTQLVFTVHATPAPQGSKTPRVSKKGKPYMTESSDRIKSWRGRVTEEAEAAIDDWLAARPHSAYDPMTGPVVLSAVFTFARPAGHYGTGRNAGRLKPSAPGRPIAHNLGDLDKLLRGVCDGLTDAGVWCDDSQVTDIMSAKVYPGGHTYAQRVPGAYIVVTEVNGTVPPDPIKDITERMLQL